MFNKGFFAELLLLPLKIFLQVKDNQNKNLNNPSKFLIVWRDDNLGILLSSGSLFRAVKESYSNSTITLLTNNDIALQLKKPELKTLLGLGENDNIIGIDSFTQFKKHISNYYDVAIVPAYSKYIFSSYVLMRLAKVKYRIGVLEIDGDINPFRFLFDKRVQINWSEFPDTHISQFILELLKPFGISTKKYVDRIVYQKINTELKNNILSKFNIKHGYKLIGIDNDPELLQHKWGTNNLVKLLEQIIKFGNYSFYFVGESATSEISRIMKKYNLNYYSVAKNNIDELLILLEVSALFISIDSNIMHIAGITNVSQISIFGSSNPFNWAPIGDNKHFLRNSDLTNDLKHNEVFELAKKLLNSREVN